jgi:VanZ family protein
MHVGVEMAGFEKRPDPNSFTVRRAQQNPVFYWMRFGLLVSWAGLLSFLSLPLLLNSSIPYRRLVICTVAIIITGALVPKVLLVDVVEFLCQTLRDEGARAHTVASQQAGSSTLTKVQKAGHLLFFAVLVYGIRAQGHRFAFVLYYCIFLAVGTECAQFFVPGRSPGILDFLIDLIGIGAGLAIWGGVQDRQEEDVAGRSVACSQQGRWDGNTA